MSYGVGAGTLRAAVTPCAYNVLRHFLLTGGSRRCPNAHMNSVVWITLLLGAVALVCVLAVVAAMMSVVDLQD